MKTSKFFSVRYRPDQPIFIKIAVQSSPVSQKWLQSWSSPDPCSSLVATHNTKGSSGKLENVEDEDLQ